MVAVDAEFPCLARLLLQAAYGGGRGDALLRHQAIRRPLAAADCDQAGRRHQERVVARQFRRVLLATLLDQRTDAGEDAKDVAFGGRALQVVARGIEDELDLVGQRHRVERNFR